MNNDGTLILTDHSRTHVYISLHYLSPQLNVTKWTICHPNFIVYLLNKLSVH